jgi:hypothetical protein
VVVAVDETGQYQPALGVDHVCALPPHDRPHRRPRRPS